eukprot:6954559-Alexandrium_andersonii.AAC.1
MSDHDGREPPLSEAEAEPEPGPTGGQAPASERSLETEGPGGRVERPRMQGGFNPIGRNLSLIHISEPTRLALI